MATTEGAAPRLRPLGLGEILDVAFKICLRHWKTLVLAVGIVVVPVQVLSAIVVGSAFGTEQLFDLDASQTMTDEELQEQVNSFLGGLAITLLLGIISTALATGACLRAVAQAYLAQPTDWRSSLGYALKRLHSLLWVLFLYTFAWLIGTIFFIAPGIWLYVAFAFCLPALLVEGRRGFKSLGRSFELVTGSWWRTCGILALAALLAFVLSSIAQTIFFVPLLFSLDNFVLFVVMTSLAGTLGAMVSTPLQAAVLTILYFDLRVRKEAFDLELLAAEIGAPAPALPAAAAQPAPPAQPDPTFAASSMPGVPAYRPAPAPEDPPRDAGPEQARPPE